MFRHSYRNRAILPAAILAALLRRPGWLAPAGLPAL